MYNCEITFLYPWLLFLLIPAFGLVFFHHFRSSKKYRRNRNKIVSIVCHLLVMTLAILAISGLMFEYDKPNTDNELVLLVDMSDSNETAQAQKDDFVLDVIDETEGRYKVGVVLYGYDHVLAAPMSYDIEEVKRRYQNAQLPDTTATDIASALDYSRTLFENPKSAKIIVLSDGIETDGAALTAVRSVAADGIRVDAKCYGNPENDEAEIIDVTVPDYNLVVGDPFTLTVKVNSTLAGQATLVIEDNETPKASYSVFLNGGVQDIVIRDFELDSPGMHRLKFELSADFDNLDKNNAYYSYINIEVYDRILIIERTTGESDTMENILTSGTDFTVDKITVTDKDHMPKTVDELRMYDEVVLFNIANADMPEGFDRILHTYVNEFGGGMLTVGGNKEDGSANTYDRDDLAGTLYQEMLPVQAIHYTPPVGVMFVMDASGSMEGTDATGRTYLEIAKEAIISCVRYSLSERDYVGAMVLTDEAADLSPMIPVPQMARVLAAVERIAPGGGTVYQTSLERAESTLEALTSVEKKHIILMSDGAPADSLSQYGTVIQRAKSKGITTTIVTIGDGSGANISDMDKAAEMGGGHHIQIKDISKLTEEMRKELEAEEITGVNYETFQPIIGDHTSVVSGISQADIPTLDGFYGTKIKADDTLKVPLKATYVPMYAQWKYGKGSVGSFMCDLNGEWSADFIADETGKKLIRNIATALFPTTNIRPKDLDIELKWENYTTTMSVFTDLDLDAGEKIEALIKPQNKVLTDFYAESDDITRITFEAGYTRATFAVKTPGVHEVIVRKVDAAGNVISETSEYRVFSYSKEYDVLADVDGAEFMKSLSERGKGNVIVDAWEALDGFEEVVHVVFDPRLILCIVALVLFLLDIAVRKFKFKWIHELIRDRKLKKASAERQGR